MRRRYPTPQPLEQILGAGPVNPLSLETLRRCVVCFLQVGGCWGRGGVLETCKQSVLRMWALGRGQGGKVRF